MGFRLTEAAELDLINIYVEGAGRFGVDQANLYHDRLSHSFDLIASNPRLARERRELIPPVRVHPCGVHVIVYVIDERGVLAVRVRHQREDWIDHPL